MRLKNWFARFAIACTISLVAAAQSPVKAPLVAVLDAADAAQWQAWTASAGWRVVAVPDDPMATIDRRVQSLAELVQTAVADGTADPHRVYLAGRGESAALVFYAIARIPDRWTAGVALGGSPKAAIDTNRVFAANFTQTPVLWASSGATDEALAGRLKDAGINLTWRSAEAISNAAVLQWLAGHVRDDSPLTIDCETNSPSFGGCYWIRMTRFDAGERNDVLPMSLVPGDAGASLDLGGFGYRAEDPGPGVGVVFLPEKYNGPLKVGDRLVALDGKPLDNVRQLQQTLARADATRNAVVMIQRAKDRIRLETRILVPRRDPVVTARVKAEYSPEAHQIVVISRSVTEMHLTLPAEWLPADVVWNGLTLETIQAPGCLALQLEKELLHAAPCR